MNIGEAINSLRSGKWIRRAGWNGKGMHVYLEEQHSEGGNRKYADYLVLFTAQGVHQPGWNASTPDLLANDWEVIPEDEMK